MSKFAIIGCGFVADLYMGSFRTMPEAEIVGVYDLDHARLKTFCDHWNLKAMESREALFEALPEGGIVLNLTNPDAHFAVSSAALEAGFHVYSEKPLATRMDDARALHALAGEKGLLLASAPCSVLGETAQTLARAVRKGVAGTPRLVYAELDDGFISQAPYDKWTSESGAPWPAEDEFRVGCTLEHAGYYLTWLMAMFGPVKTVVAASATVVPGKVPGEETAPDVSIATLFFEGGMVARLTCTIVAPHDHQIRVVGDKGTLAVKEAWNNAAPVKFHRRFTLRRRLVDMPVGRKVRLDTKETHPKVGRWGAASMNFALGPMEMLQALTEGRDCRLSADFALHLNEVTLAIQGAGAHSGAQEMTTRCELMEPMPWAG
ncbi:Gfo/Idh/MocA family protein [Algicella marina]|uniref:Gfo/Idh/MocA family oxidoreductase n=1 Tax=Algicella marina TaxID=2683284 RepID=A0A6P1SXL1_9RHOB|nr:Gfo/Idh/MocA family oxidoreductase [Algicella marina]QHQ34073.1 gfo/Idh/MocA family oxidoreductase [Algicella marina]